MEKLPTQKPRKGFPLRLDEKAESDLLYLQDSCCPDLDFSQMPSQNAVACGAIKFIASEVRRYAITSTELKLWLGMD